MLSKDKVRVPSR